MTLNNFWCEMTINQQPVDSVTIARPDDWHVHLRDGAMLKAVLPYTARAFGRAIVMPNLRPPVTTTAQAQAYRAEIIAALPEGSDFQPLMTLYLTDHTDPDDLKAGFEAGIVTAVKLYPAHATTNSDHGVGDLKAVRSVLEMMQKIGMPLLMHGEVTDPEVDIFDREAVFIDKILQPLRGTFPALKMVLEHITTRQAVDYLDSEGGATLGATITAHHLRINRNAMFQGGIRPHYYCLPIAKREDHRVALVKAATSGKACYFLGTDTAPHPKKAKESACGCAGLFTAINALEVYTQVFAEHEALGKLEAFASLNGPRFYGLPVHKQQVTLERVSDPQPSFKPILTADGAEIIPYEDAKPIVWRLK